MKHAFNIASPIIIIILFIAWCMDHHFAGDSDTYTHQAIAVIIVGLCVAWLVGALAHLEGDL